MLARNDSPNHNETFGRLLSGAINSIATYEGRMRESLRQGASESALQ